MIKINNISIYEEPPKFNSLEDVEKYFYREIAEEKRWGLLYPIIIGIKLFVCRLMRIKKEIVWAFQRIARKHHASDIDFHCFDFHIAMTLLPKLEAFRKQDFHVWPNGELEIWLNILDEIIYAFRWNIYANWEKNPKKERKFYTFYFGVDDPDLDFFHYHESELVKKAAVRAQKGFELFGKYFTCLWNYIV